MIIFSELNNYLQKFLGHCLTSSKMIDDDESLLKISFQAFFINFSGPLEFPSNYYYFKAAHKTNMIFNYGGMLGRIRNTFRVGTGQFSDLESPKLKTSGAKLSLRSNDCRKY